MTDRELNALLDLHLWGRVWDETKCRVCGLEFAEWHCEENRCCTKVTTRKRADDPVDHLTDAQMRLDREKLRGMDSPSGKHSMEEEFVVALMVGNDFTIFDAIHATPRQQCVAMLRALGVEVEG